MIFNDDYTTALNRGEQSAARKVGFKTIYPGCVYKQ
jgi:hypothetical protein